MLQITQEKNKKENTPLAREIRQFNRYIKQFNSHKTTIDKHDQKRDKAHQYEVNHIFPLLVELKNGYLELFKKINEVIKTEKLSKRYLTSYFELTEEVLMRFDAQMSEEDMNVFLAIMQLQMQFSSKAEQKKLKKSLSEQLGLDPNDLEGGDWNVEDIFKKMDEQEARDAEGKSKDEEPHEADFDADFGDFKDFEQRGKYTQPEHEETLEELFEVEGDIELIYKRLVKIIHPDLERDETKKPQRELDMQRLNLARKKGDFFELLRLQSEYISGENFQDLTQIQKFNRYLKAKLSKLEDERYEKEQMSHFSSIFGRRQSEMTLLKRAATHLKDELGQISKFAKNMKASYHVEDFIDIRRYW